MAIKETNAPRAKEALADADEREAIARAVREGRFNIEQARALIASTSPDFVLPNEEPPQLYSKDECWATRDDWSEPLAVSGPDRPYTPTDPLAKAGDESVDTCVNDRQLGGAHYKGGYEPWDFITDWKLGFLEGNVVKYIVRYRQKNGLSDLDKAVHYLDKLVEVASLDDLVPRLHQREGCAPLRAVEIFAKGKKLNPTEFEVIRLISQWSCAHSDLKKAKEMVEKIRKEYATTTEV